VVEKMSDESFVNWFGEFNYRLMDLTDPWLFILFASLMFLGAVMKMTPLRYDIKHQFTTVIAIYIRKIILWILLALIFLPLLMMYLYEMTNAEEIGDHTADFTEWFTGVFNAHWWMFPTFLLVGWVLRFSSQRYIVPIASKVFRSLRFTQSDDKLSNIEDELERFSVKEYNPQKYYKLDDQVFMALDQDNDPIYVPRKTWVEVNMQIIGPTRYGKGVEAGVIADQGIRAGDSVFYIAPKKEKFMPHIMKAAAEAKGKKFYYVDLTDEGPGKWGPFLGGTARDALSRLYNAVGLNLTGNPGTDFYKTRERQELVNVFERGRSLKAIIQNIDESSASKAYSSISEWLTIETFNCKAGQGFSIEKALKENAVVYIQGALTDPVVKMMMKIFIIELVQEAARVEDKRNSHLTVFVDEVRFLVSKELADALATIVGFDVNFILMYQSILDLTAPDDTTLNGRALLQSVNVNSQLKAIYGGADPETAEWIAALSGEKTLSVSKMEKTEVLSGGGEIYESGRMIGTESVALIHSNIVKVLPPMVCALFQPRATAKIAYTSWVKVESETPLNDHLKKLSSKAKQPMKPSSNAYEESNKVDLHPMIEEGAEELKTLENDFNLSDSAQLNQNNTDEDKKRAKRQARKKNQKNKKKGLTEAASEGIAKDIPVESIFQFQSNKEDEILMSNLSGFEDEEI
jgi:type IV secretory system conjugative DNA transfer VirD4/TraG family protein